LKREISGPQIHVNRIEALTDGVFAIAMTILVLSLEVPSRNQITSQSELVQNVMGKGYQFMSYFISFFVIGSIWISTIRRRTACRSSTASRSFRSLPRSPWIQPTRSHTFRACRSTLRCSCATRRTTTNSSLE